MTRKKIQQVATQQSAEYRGTFMAEIQLYSWEQFVWIDEIIFDVTECFFNWIVVRAVWW